MLIATNTVIPGAVLGAATAIGMLAAWVPKRCAKNRIHGTSARPNVMVPGPICLVGNLVRGLGSVCRICQCKS